MRIDACPGGDPGALLFSGRVQRLATAARELSVLLRDRLPGYFNLTTDAADEELEYIHKAYDATTLYRMIAAARSRVLADRELDRAARSLLAIFDADGELYFDGPRMRVVPHDAFRIPAAASAYYVHRDTWFANPAAQWNLWIPIFSTPAERGFAIYPDCFAQAVPNDSARFDLAEWNAAGGFQAGPDARNTVRKQFHPRLDPAVALEDLGPPLNISGLPGECVLFSAQHLHGTVPNASGRTRFSLELRVVRRRDILENRGALQVDNGSRGSTLTTMRSIRDASPWPHP